jgi:DNA-binding ferritin-like protein
MRYSKSMKNRTINKSMNKNKTRSMNKSMNKSKYSHQHIVSMFLQMLNTVKLYHWKTTSFAQHKATDELYSQLNESIDSFVEIMLGKSGSRVNLTGTKTIPLLDYTELSGFKTEVEQYKHYLIGMSNDEILKNGSNTDLLNVRDEILGHLNQFTYLLTFK